MNNADLNERIKNLYYLSENAEKISQQFKDLIYELFKKDQWPTYKEITEYFKISTTSYSSFYDAPMRDLVNEIELIMKRNIMAAYFTFAIPSFEAIELITKYQPVLEIGAGSGFWAALLKKNNCNIIATTIDDIHHPFPEKFTDIEKLTALEALKKYPSRTVFCSWPSIGAWAEEALPYISDRLIFIGEKMGSSASNNFYNELEEKFELEEELTIPQWHLIYDYLYVYRRKIKNR